MRWAERDPALAVRGVGSDLSMSLSTEDMQIRRWSACRLQTPTSLAVTRNGPTGTDLVGWAARQRQRDGTCQGAELEKWACIFPSPLTVQSLQESQGWGGQRAWHWDQHQQGLLCVAHNNPVQWGPAVLWPPEVEELARKICLWG